MTTINLPDYGIKVSVEGWPELDGIVTTQNEGAAVHGVLEELVGLIARVRRSERVEVDVR